MSGFLYEVECIAHDGTVRWAEKVYNIIPTAGQNYILGAALNNVSRYTAWYVGLFANNYTPTVSDTMSTFIAAAGEITAYAESTRIGFTPDGITTGLFSNYTTPADFTANGNSTVRGGFLTSDSVKSGTNGLLLSAALFASPRSIISGEVLRVRAGLQLVSA